MIGSSELSGSQLDRLIELSAALLSPIVAMFALILAIQSFRLARAKRKDDLFQQRYEFYSELETWWLSTGNAADGPKTLGAEWYDLRGPARKSRFLFGPDIEEHILSLEDKTHDGHPWVVDEAFERPFLRYLELRASA
ncbi:hypothetical protein [Palleronia rufa]|uniref:hypothetical protein n=1 Tax=Palleronia rufa TaxID=1530186 RepID=UPI001268ABE0|nr:hypothetical protein [Palleronia rufa]